MQRRRILDRLHETVQSVGVYLAPVEGLPPRERRAALEIRSTLRADGPETARALVDQLFAAGALSRAAKASALHVIAASPQVKDYAEALRMADLQEYFALEDGGAFLRARLSSVDRHRGVVSFLMGRYDVAFDWFTRAFERERTAENLGNLLASLLALGERTEATSVVTTAFDRFPDTFRTELRALILADGDLAELRSLVSG